MNDEWEWPTLLRGLNASEGEEFDYPSSTFPFKSAAQISVFLRRYNDRDFEPLGTLAALLDICDLSDNLALERHLEAILNSC